MPVTTLGHPSRTSPHGHLLDDQCVRDACVEQVLTHAHLDAASDLSDWRVEEVAVGRFRVAYRYPSRWFLPAPACERGTRVDPEILAKAREDFRSMVLTGSDM